MPNGRHFALQIRIGVFILAGLGVFLAIIYLLGAQARYFERKYDLVAEFTEVGGLLNGASVRLAGVQIGRVTSVDLPPRAGGKVRVTLAVAKRFQDRIRQDSEARIVTQGLLGDKLVEITLGSAEAPPLPPGGTLRAQEPFEIGRMFAEGTQTLGNVNELAVALRSTVERVNRVADRVDRIGQEVETGKGWLHVLIYDEPDTLRRLNALLASTQSLLDRAQSGDHAVSVLLSRDSGRAARSLLQAMAALGEALGRPPDKPGAGEGLLAALLYDPEYKSVVQDLQVVARNFREVSEKVARGEGLLGELLEERAERPLHRAAADFRVAVANLRALSERLQAGEGTLGALLEDPTVYENLVQFLEGARRSFLLRALIRSTLSPEAATGAATERAR